MDLRAPELVLVQLQYGHGVHPDTSSLGHHRQQQPTLQPAWTSGIRMRRWLQHLRLTRNVAYAVTSQRIDPLYALSFADPKNLKDSIGGERPVRQHERVPPDRDNNNFLLAIGQDNSSTCAACRIRTAPSRPTSRPASSTFATYQDSLVQRQCVQCRTPSGGLANHLNLDQATR